MASAGRELATGATKPDPDLNRKTAERVRFAKALHERFRWTVQDFAEKLGKEDAGICGKTECGLSHVTEAHFKRVFPKTGGSGIRIVPNEFITEEECASVLQLYLAMYNHPPPNKEYGRYFLRSWLAERDGKAKINWAKFAFDICKKQYVAWERDGRVKEALATKWDDLQTLPTSSILGHGGLQGNRRQIGSTCEPIRFSEEQSDAVLEMLGDAETDCHGIGPKL